MAVLGALEKKGSIVKIYEKILFLKNWPKFCFFGP
jgi:hypothetical protein